MKFQSRFIYVGTFSGGILQMLEMDSACNTNGVRRILVEIGRAHVWTPVTW
jgi:hypothetical protein